MLNNGSGENRLEMSVVLGASDGYKGIHNTITYLLAQEKKEELEMVIVAPSTASLLLDEEAQDELEQFGNYQVVEINAACEFHTCYAAGVRAARAPVVVFAEDHCFPQKGWARALLKAHQQDQVAVVGPVFRNGNPSSRVSWADFLINYGPWIEPQDAGPREHLPGHNSSYKRDVLLGYGPQLTAMLETESVLHWHLRKKGYVLYLEPAAKVDHRNISCFRPFVSIQFYWGRVFAASRMRGQPQWRRLLYTGASPLIPAVRLWRTWKICVAAGKLNVFRRAFPFLVLGFLSNSLGEALGYAWGTGNALRRLAPLELRAYRMVEDSAAGGH